MESTKNKQILLGVVAVIMLAAAGWLLFGDYIFSSSNTGTPAVVQNSTPTTGDAVDSGTPSVGKTSNPAAPPPNPRAGGKALAPRP
jgi:hypothetical protein